MSDVFLVLAQAPGGLTCFIVPRVLPDGTRNVFEIQRLKDKLGNRSNASSEIEFNGTWAQRLGEEGAAFEPSSRWCRHAAGHGSGLHRPHAQGAVRGDLARGHREAFGARLIDQPLMRQVLADMALEVEAATWLGIRLAHRGGRLVGRFERASRVPSHRPADVEVLRVQARARADFRGDGVPGGVGYVEDTGMPPWPKPGGSGQLHLGGLGQRERFGSAACHFPQPREFGRLPPEPRPGCRL